MQQRFVYDGWDVILEQQADVENGWGYITYFHFWFPGGEHSLLIGTEYVAGYILDARLTT